MNIPRPHFDLWFWLLLVYAFVAPYLYDAGHVASCNNTGKVVFEPIDLLWTGKLPAFWCQPMDEPREDEVPTERGEQRRKP
jgi:hypothetical protein